MKYVSFGKAWPNTWFFGIGVSITDSVCFIITFGPWALLIGPHTKADK